MTRKESVKRYGLLVVSLFFSALGVAVTKHGELGVSPISSVANVMSCKFTFLSLGMWLIVWNGVLIAGQILILRRKFQLIQLLQIPVSFLFGYFTDFGTWCVSAVPADFYPVRLVLVIAGVVTLGFGVALSFIANVVMNSGEAFVKAVADTWHRDLGNTKIAFDVGCVVSAVLLSLIFFDMKLVGTREGTIIAAFLTGLSVKVFIRFFNEPLTKFLTRG